jgi:hypothetical protein
MFNFSRFNIQKFNIVNVTESDFAYSDTFAEAFGSDSILSIGLTLTETHEEDFDSFTDVIVGFRYAETFVETFDMSLAMLINSYVIETHAEDIIAGIVVAGDSPLVETHTDNLVAGVKLGIDIPLWDKFMANYRKTVDAKEAMTELMMELIDGTLLGSTEEERTENWKVFKTLIPRGFSTKSVSKQSNTKVNRYNPSSDEDYFLGTVDMNNEGLEIVLNPYQDNTDVSPPQQIIADRGGDLSNKLNELTKFSKQEMLNEIGIRNDITIDSSEIDKKKFREWLINKGIAAISKMPKKLVKISKFFWVGKFPVVDILS